MDTLAEFTVAESVVLAESNTLVSVVGIPKLMTVLVGRGVG